MKKALVLGERIFQIEENVFPVAPPLIWVDVPDDTSVEDTYKNGQVVKNIIGETTWDDIRNERNALLAACDWTQLPDAALTEDEKSAWAEYRQALRDITDTFASPGEVVFPDPPAF